MSALTTQDIALGWFIIGGVCFAAGIFLGWGVMDWWSERKAQEAEHTITTPNPGSVRFEAECTQSLAIAAHTAHAVSRVAAIPTPRQPFDYSKDGI